MKYKSLLVLAILTSLLSVGCSSDSESSVDRAGPQELAGESWKGPEISISVPGGNEIKLQPSFKFFDDRIEVSNTCDGGRTVTTSSPVRYHYTANILKDDRNETRNGDNYCWVEVKKGIYELEVVGQNLKMTRDEMTQIFNSTESGKKDIYSTWVAGDETDGKVEFTFGNGVIEADASCPGGLSASIVAETEYKNYVEILQSNQGGDEACNVSVVAGDLEYRFDGSDIVVTFMGETTRFSR